MSKKRRFFRRSVILTTLQAVVMVGSISVADDSSPSEKRVDYLKKPPASFRDSENALIIGAPPLVNRCSGESGVRPTEALGYARASSQGLGRAEHLPAHQLP